MKTSSMDSAPDTDLFEPRDASYGPGPGSRRLAALVLIGLTGVFLVSIFYTASRLGADGQYFTLCGFKAFTGLPCPGCGLTHSFCAIGKGHIVDAFAFNAIGPPLYLVAILVWLRFLFALAGINAPVALFDRTVDHIKLVRTFVIALGVYGVGRIVFLIIWQPQSVEGAPILRLLERVLH